MAEPVPEYLEPYASATRRHGVGIRSLLWASGESQGKRFDAIRRATDLNGKLLLDAGCGTGDLLSHLIRHDVMPAHYVGLEAMPEFVTAARQRRFAIGQFVLADFVREPVRMLVGADVTIFCGSLNTLTPRDFAITLDHAYAASTEAVLFNFLSSPRLARGYLSWYKPGRVEEMGRLLGAEVTLIDDYLDGDCTALFRKPKAASFQS